MDSSSDVVLDLARLAEITDGDADVIEAVLSVYLETSSADLAAVVAAAAQRDQAALAAASHRLRGASHSAGAPRVASLAGTLEGCARASDLSGAATIIERLSAELVRFQAAAAAVMAPAA